MLHDRSLRLGARCPRGRALEPDTTTTSLSRPPRVHRPRFARRASVRGVGIDAAGALAARSCDFRPARSRGARLQRDTACAPHRCAPHRARRPPATAHPNTNTPPARRRLPHPLPRPLPRCALLCVAAARCAGARGRSSAAGALAKRHMHTTQRAQSTQHRMPRAARARRQDARRRGAPAAVCARAAGDAGPMQGARALGLERRRLGKAPGLEAARQHGEARGDAAVCQDH